MIIYLVENITNHHVYIGKTIHTLSKRKYEHCRSAKKGSNTYFHKALRKYGKDNFEWEEICNADNEEELNEKEIYYIKIYRDYGFQLYNLTEGGEGTSGLVQSEESRIKISNARKGKKRSEEVKKKMSEAHKGKLFSEESIRKMSEAKKGRIFSEESKQKMSISHGGKPFYILKDNTILEEYSSQRSCARKYTLNQSKISECLNKRIKNTKGYTFIYVEDYKGLN